MNEQFRAARERKASPANPQVILSRRELAELVHAWLQDHRGLNTAIDEVHIGKIERGEIRWPNADYRTALRAVLNVSSDSDLGFRRRRDTQIARTTAEAPPVPAPDVDGVDAIELLRRSEATDLGPRTLDAIANAVDRLASSYTHIAPVDLLGSLRTYQGYLSRLLDGRATLVQRAELMRQAGWVSLLTATADVDVGLDRAAAANFEAAGGLAAETGDAELAAWVLETQAWQALSTGDLALARQRCEAGLRVAPEHTSAHVQMCTQSARVSARLGDAAKTHRMIEVCLTAVDQLPSADRLEHHFICEPRRVIAHCAAALVWLGDTNTTTEDYARAAVAQYESDDGHPYVHHLATSRMNLALLLARTDQPDEAAHLAILAFDASWRLCRTDLFLAGSVDQELTSRYDGSSAVTECHDRYVGLRESVAAGAIMASQGQPRQLPPPR